MFKHSYFFPLFKKTPKDPIIIFESDDWGTIRMRNKEVLEKINKVNPTWVDDPFMKLDCLESNKDIEELFEILLKHKDINGNYACITANTIMQNPDFSAIRNNGFTKFEGKAFNQMYMDYPDSNQVLELQKKGFYLGIYYPQYHGREHIQIKRWLDGLKKNAYNLRIAFDLGLISFYIKSKVPCISYFMDAMNPVNKENLDEIIEIQRDGLEKFRLQWGFSSRSIIAPCYFWNSVIEPALLPEGVMSFQGLRVQKQSVFDTNDFRFKKIYHRQFSINKFHQIFLVRKAFFEPSLNPYKDWIDSCLNEISMAIQNDRIAIISCHRINFMGSICMLNRERNLKMFDLLLKRIKDKFPDCKFYHTAQLVDELISNLKLSF